MWKLPVTLFALVSSLTVAGAKDLGYEEFARVVDTYYQGQYGVLVPFAELPDAASDPTRQAEGYPGQIWNFATQRATRGVIYTHQDRYCPAPDTPAPIVVGTTQVKNFQIRRELSLLGDITVTGADPANEIFKLTALDAKYIKSIKIDVAKVKRSYLPFNILSATVNRAIQSCGPGYFYALTSALVGDVTITVSLQRGVDAGINATIANRVKIALKLKADAVDGGTEASPALIFSEGPKIFAVRPETIPLKK